MTDRDALLRSILEHPQDDTPRLVYADWLDDAGGADRAEFIRVQVELARIVQCQSPRREGIFRGKPLVEVCGQCEYCVLRHRERELLHINGRNADKWFGGSWTDDGERLGCPGHSIRLRGSIIIAVAMPLMPRHAPEPLDVPRVAGAGVRDAVSRGRHDGDCRGTRRSP